MSNNHHAPKSALYSLHLLRKHYQTNIEQNEKQILESQYQIEFAKEQLIHVQALLGDIKLVDDITEGLITTYLDRELKLK